MLCIGCLDYGHLMYKCIMIPKQLYFLPLLPWTKKTLQTLFQPLGYTLWRKGENMGATWISWDHLTTPKQLGGVANLFFGNAFHGS